MKRLPFPALWLRLRLALTVNPLVCIAALLLLAGAGSLAWLVQARQVLDRERELVQRMAQMPPPSVKAEPQGTASDNLALFYRSLGERNYAEQQVKTLFELAAKSGLVLHQGEYREGFVRGANIQTYQVTLPIKGSYKAVWDFALQALLAIPFASLDDISFRRDAIGDANVEARLRFTLYLADRTTGDAR
jgi:hypothetical protein